MTYLPSASWSRRRFLTAVTGAGFFAVPFTSRAMTRLLTPGPDRSIDPRVAAIVAATIGIDTHNHIEVPLKTAELPGPRIDLAGEMKKSGLAAICMTVALDYQKLTREGEAWERFQNAMTAMDAALKNNGMSRSLNLADLLQAHKDGRPTVIQSLEGSHFLEGHTDRLKTAYDRGLRHLTLLHDSDASTPLGDVFTNPPKFGGLTAFGAEVIGECNRLGILVDLSHASADTVDAALKITAHPVIVSHTAYLDPAKKDESPFTRMMAPRLINKERAKIVAAAGGVIGVWTHGADTALAYAQHIRELVDIVGVDHVAMGTDTKLTPAYHSPGDPGPGFGNGRPPKSGDRPKPSGGESTNTLWPGDSNGFYYSVVDGLLKTGFTDEEIGKIGGGNFCRVFNAATSG